MDKLHNVDDIVYSDSDTVPECSNRDGSKEFVDARWQLIMVRVPDYPNESHTKQINEAIINEMRATWKTPPTSFAFASAPHIPILKLAQGITKKHFGEKAPIRSNFLFSEPRNEKFYIPRDSELKLLNFEVIFGTSRFNWNKVETQVEVAKRIESTMLELIHALPNLVLFLGPIAFDSLYETLEKQKRIPVNTTKPGVIVENFKRENSKWKRLQKHGAMSISAPLC